MSIVRQIAVALTTAATPARIAPEAHLFAPVTTLTAERVEMDATSIAPETMFSRLALSVRPGAKTLEGRSRLCPHLMSGTPRPTLRCLTPRFSATLDPKSGAVTVVQLRALPWRNDDDGPPRWFYDPDDLTKPLHCPGKTAIAEAECAYQSGEFDRAYAEFGAVHEGPARGFASLRLGDLALAHDDTAPALEAFDDARRPSSPVASLAVLRRCELIDDCNSLILDPLRYPEALRGEAILRIARHAAYADQWSEVVHLIGLSRQSGSDKGPNGAEATRLERRLLIGALQVPETSGDAQATERNDDRLTHALELYLDDPNRLTGRYAEELTDAAAEAAAHLGTPRFGANIMAAVFPAVAVRHRSAHLVRTAELYLDDDDAAHAEAIYEFAHTQFAPGELRAARWRQVGRRLRQYGDGARVRADEALAESLRRQVQLSREVSEAVRVTSSARQASQERP